jgi:hypothetical protein
LTRHRRGQFEAHAEFIALLLVRWRIGKWMAA